MTVIPTVRRQLQDAVERQATTRSARVRRRMGAIQIGHSRATQSPSEARTASSRRRVRITPGAVVGGLGVIMALGVAILAVALLGHRRMPVTSPASSPAGRYRLTAMSIGNVTFGQGPKTVAAGLERLLGPPASASGASRIGYVRSICGFYHEIDWTLAASPNARSDALTVYFKHSRFVGYSYGAYGGPEAPVVRHGPQLATTKGLGLADTLARGRQLYGPAFIVTTQPQGTPPSKRLERLPAWEVHTASGRIHGFIDSPSGTRSTQQRTIESTSAGAVPNTPCR